MRMIDADAMLAGLKPITYEMEHMSVLISDMSNIMRNWVEHQPTLTPPNEWVGVEDRLPNEDGEYLVYTEDGYVFSATFNSCCGERGEFGRWDDIYDGETMAWCGSRWTEAAYVTHWMPLLAPPDSRPPEGEGDKI